MAGFRGVLRARAVLSWQGEKIEKHIKDHMLARLQTAMNYLAGITRLNISRRRQTSKPGQFPARKEGELARSIEWQINKRKMTGSIGSYMPYAKWLEYGTQGGKVIWPKRKQVLSWIDEDTGERVFRRYVIQGAIKDRSFLQRTVEQETKWLTNHFGKELPASPKGTFGLINPVSQDDTNL